MSIVSLISTAIRRQRYAGANSRSDGQLQVQAALRPCAALLLMFLLAAGITLQASTASAEILPTDDDRCPFTSRFPVEITLEGIYQIPLLGDWKIDIDQVRGLTVTAYVDDREFGDLAQAGYAVRAIPNQARRAYLEMVRAGREDYHSYEGLTAELQQIAADYPAITSLSSIGQSVEGRELWMMKISDNVTVDEPEPEFKYTATMHGDEPPGTEFCVYLIRLLVENYGSDPELTALVDDLEIWICPLHNPDGYFHGTRYNAQGFDLNREFPDPVTDPNDDPAGRPIEVQHMMRFVYDHNFILGANYHTGALVVNYPWDSMYGQYTADDTMIRNLSQGYAILNPPMYNNPQFPGGITIGWEWYVIHGGMQDWSYYWRNEVHVTIEVCNTKWPPATWLPGLWDDNRDAMLWYMDQSRIGVEGFVTDAGDGYPIKATYDVVEIGKPMWGEPTYGYYHRLLEPGTYTIDFSAFGYNPYTASNVVVSAGDPAILNVQLTATARHTVSGVVTEAGTGLPLAGEVTAYRSDNGEIFRIADTDPATGAYTMEVPAWQYDFVASAPEHVPVTETRSIMGDTAIDFALPLSRGSVLLVTDNNPEPNMTADLVALGFLVNEETAGATDPATWRDYDLLIWSAGSYRNPVAAEADRDAIEAHVAGGGTLLIEGGEFGYDAAVNPGYPTFAANVLHISGFDADNAGQLEMRPDQIDHPIVTTPNALPATVQITYDYFGDQDAVQPLGDATLIYGTQSYPNDAGILVYDFQDRGEGQIVYYAFDYNALTSATVAGELLENTVEYLILGGQGVYEPAAAPMLRLSRLYPSITRGSVVFQLSLTERGPAQIAVYDAAGRRVQQIHTGELSAGAHTLQWDGRDDAGHAAASGVYFLRAASSAGEIARRLVVVE
jgi:carboxypeptidase D